MPVMLHGLVPQGTRRQAGPDHELVDCGRFLALISTAPEGLSELAPEAITDLALHHNEVLVGYCGAVAVLPMRFGAAFSSSAVVSAHLSAEAVRHLRALNAVAGLAEYIVQVSILGEPPMPERAATSGKEFLKRGRDLRDLRQNLSARRVHLVRGVREALVALSQSCEAAGKAKPGRLPDLAVLVDRSTIQKLSDLVTGWAKEASPLGLSVQMTGPWPAYSFRFTEARHDA